VGTSVQVHIAPPWWDTWWARAAMLASIALLVMLVVRLRLASARRRSRTLEQRVEKQTRELTHAQDRLRIALDREREAARELLDITAAVPGAVFQMRMNEDGERDFTFV